MNFALGTVQFGMKYGVANQGNETSLEEVYSILQLCKKSGIDTIDTAIDYGTSENKLGQASVKDFKVVTKISITDPYKNDISGWIREQLISSLERLRINSVYGLLLHESSDLLLHNKQEIVSTLNSIKSEGLISKIGCSIYDPSELSYIKDSMDVDIIQAPLNIIDRRLIDTEWLRKLNNNSIEVHTRSCFLQGLLLMEENKLPQKLNHSKILFRNWHQFLKENNISKLSACISYIKSIQKIDKVLIGVQNRNQLEEIINCPIKKLNLNELEFMHSSNLNLIDPSRW